MRLFVAITFPDSVNKQLAALCQGIERAKWVRPEQIHLTLRFIGDMPIEQFDSLRLALSEVKGTAFALQLKGVGTFPPPQESRRPKVLWVGVAPNPSLFELHAGIETALRTLEHPKDKHGFNAHVTLARFQKPPSTDLRAWQKSHHNFETGKVEIPSFHLIQSQPAPKGANYSMIETYQLDKPLRP